VFQKLQQGRCFKAGNTRMAYNHVVTLNEGVRQEGNQWGPEHGMEIDQFAAERIEILKVQQVILWF